MVDEFERVRPLVLLIDLFSNYFIVSASSFLDIISGDVVQILMQVSI